MCQKSFGHMPPHTPHTRASSSLLEDGLSALGEWGNRGILLSNFINSQTPVFPQSVVLLKNLLIKCVKTHGGMRLQLQHIPPWVFGAFPQRAKTFPQSFREAPGPPQADPPPPTEREFYLHSGCAPSAKREFCMQPAYIT